MIRPANLSNPTNPTDPNRQVKFPEIGQFVTHYADPAPAMNCSPVETRCRATWMFRS